MATAIINLGEQKKQTIASIIEEMTRVYSRPVPASAADAIDARIQKCAEDYGYDAATIYGDLRKAMAKQNKTGKREFKGIAY